MTSALNWLRDTFWNAPAIKNTVMFPKFCMMEDIFNYSRLLTELRWDECKFNVKYYNICWYETYDRDCNCFKCIEYRTYDILTKIDCYANKVITDWNGIRGGELVTSEIYKTGKRFPIPPYTVTPKTPNAVPILKFDCDAKLSFLPNSATGISARVSLFSSFYEWVYKNMYDIASCSAGKRNMKMSEKIFAIMRFLPSSLLYQFTDPVPNFHLDEYYKAMMDSWLVYPEYDPAPTNRLGTVETCSFDTWNNNGVCSFSFTGLSELFGLDLRINAVIKKCSSHEFPEIYIECAGDDCSILSKPKFCQKNSDCSSYALCTSYKDMIKDLFEFYNSSTTEYKQDWIGYTITTDVIRGKCANYDKFLSDVANILGIWSKQTPGEKVCGFDLKHFLTVLPTWGQSQISEQGSIFRLNNLLRWNV